MGNPLEMLAGQLGKQNNMEKNGEFKEPTMSPSSTGIELLIEKVKELEEKVKSMDKPRRNIKDKEKGAE
jgi:hypothetical protein